MTRLGATPPEKRPRAAAWLVLAAACVAGFVLLTAAVLAHVVFSFDQPVVDAATAWTVSPDVWKAISESANFPLIAIAVVSVVWLIIRGRRREALLVALMLIAVTAGSEGVKQLTLRPRPETGTASGIPGVVYSYPSGHVLEALTILGFVAIRTWRAVLALAIRAVLVVAVAAEVVLVGVARIALGAHYPTDVLAGLFGGLAALGFYAWLTRPGSWADRPARATGRSGSDAPGPVAPLPHRPA